MKKCFLGTSWDATTGLPTETDFERNTYDTMARIIAPDTVAQTLRLIYGDQLSTPQFHLSDRETRELRLANQFMFIHEYVVAEATRLRPAHQGDQE